MSESVNPHDYVITRKRKKYRFAKYRNAPNCFEFDEWQKQSVDVIEVGAGTALFSVELASRHPELTFVALDVKADRLQKGAYEAIERGITNVMFIRARADQIDQLFEQGTMAAIWLTFPDPFPKKRSTGRRLTHPVYLTKYASLLKPGGALLLKHDNPEFFEWSVEQLTAEQWKVEALAHDLHISDFDDDYKILTSYERRWLGEGLLTQFVKATPPNKTNEI